MKVVGSTVSQGHCSQELWSLCTGRSGAPLCCLPVRGPDIPFSLYPDGESTHGKLSFFPSCVGKPQFFPTAFLL